MAIRDRNIDKDAEVAVKVLVVPLISAVGQTGVVAFSHTPGHAFQLVGVSSYCADQTDTISGVVKVGSATAVAAVGFTDATEVAQTLSSTLSDLRGSSTDAITLEYTSDGTGAVVNGFVIIKYRAQPLAGEVHSV